MSLSWVPPSAFSRENSGGFVSGKDSLSVAWLQWGGERRTGEENLFHLLVKRNCFIFFIKTLCYYPNR
jgi:hypothetical protein